MDAIAIWGAATGTLALAIEVFKVARDRAKVAIFVEELGQAFAVPGSYAWLHNRVRIHVTNVGRQPMAFTSVGLVLRAGSNRVGTDVVRRMAANLFIASRIRAFHRLAFALMRHERIVPLTDPSEPIWRLEPGDSKTVEATLKVIAESVSNTRASLSGWMRGMTGEVLPAKISSFYVQSSLGARVEFPIALRDSWVATIDDENLDYRVADVPVSGFPANAAVGWGTLEEMADAELTAAERAESEAESSRAVRGSDDRPAGDHTGDTGV